MTEQPQAQDAGTQQAQDAQQQQAQQAGRDVGTVDARAPGDTTKPEQQQAEKTAEQLAQEQAQQEKDARRFTQKELDEIIRKKDAKRLKERDELRAEISALRKLTLERERLETERGKTDKPQNGQPVTGEPQRANFDSYEAYMEARAEWKAEQRVDKKLQEHADRQRQQSEQATQKQQSDSFKKMLHESSEGLDDFDETIEALGPDDAASKIWGSALEACEKPGKVLYHLATHPEDAERIASLSAGKQARELMALEQKIAKPAAKPSKAPEPINPVDGKAAASEEEPDAARNPQAWTEWRIRQVSSRIGKPKVQ